MLSISVFRFFDDSVHDGSIYRRGLLDYCVFGAQFLPKRCDSHSTGFSCVHFADVFYGVGLVTCGSEAAPTVGEGFASDRSGWSHFLLVGI